MEKFPKAIKKETEKVRPESEIMKEFHRDKPITTEEVLEEMKKAGMRPVTPADLYTSKIKKTRTLKTPKLLKLKDYWGRSTEKK